MKLGEAYLRLEQMAADLREIEASIPHIPSAALDSVLESASDLVRGKGALEKKVSQIEFESLVGEGNTLADLKTTISVLNEKSSLYKKILLRPNLTDKSKNKIKDELEVCNSALYKIKETISRVSWEIDIGP